jgi:hypothetical protein
MPKIIDLVKKFINLEDKSPESLSEAQRIYDEKEKLARKIWGYVKL